MSSTSQNLRRRNRAALRIWSPLSGARQRCVAYLSIGRWGERVTSRFLSRYGLLVLRSNWRASRLEADLIAIERRELVVVEVKTRHHSLRERFPGAAAISPEKWKHLTKLTRSWMRNNGPLCRRAALRSSRIDIVEVYYRPIIGPLRVVTEVRWHRGGLNFCYPES